MIGVNIGSHDSGLCHFLVKNGQMRELEIILAERISGSKNEGGFPFPALRFFKTQSSEAWESIMNEQFAQNSFGPRSNVCERGICEKYPDYATLIEGYGLEKASSLYNPSIQFVPHHLSHAYSLFPVLPFKKCLIVVSDGMGNERQAFLESDLEWPIAPGNPDDKEHFSVYSFDEGKIVPLDKDFLHFDDLPLRGLKLGDGLGAHYALAAKLIFNNWKQAGKVMGLSAFGKATPVVDMMAYFRSLDFDKFKIFSSKKEFDSQDNQSFQQSADLAATVQIYFENVMMNRMKELKRKYPDFENVALVGGCALNGVFNLKLAKSKIFSSVYVPPFPNDEGIALGCAVKAAVDLDLLKFQVSPIESIHPFYGPIKNDINLQLDRVKGIFKDYIIEKPENLIEKVAERIGKNEIIAWMQGRSEVGPRALGNRSILCRPDIPNIKSHLNDFVKYREAFRPYGATVLKELAPEYFDVEDSFHSPFMTFCVQVRSPYLKKLAGVTHIDSTCRVQTLCKKQNSLYYELLKSCHQQFGLGVLLNTSLNLMGQPIVETIEDALLFFKKSKINYIIIGSYLIRKNNEI